MPRWLTHAAFAAGLALSLPALGQLRTDLGRFEYDNNCAACHGVSGRGDGVVALGMKRPVPDLTSLAERNAGIFPADRVRRIIDGREDLKGHLARQMPVWGLQYSARAAEYYKGLAIDPEAFVRLRIDALVEHVKSIQRPEMNPRK